MMPGWIKTADPYSLGDVPPSRVAEELFDGLARGRFLLTTHPDLLPVSLRGRLDYLIPHHPAAVALGDVAVDAAVAKLQERQSAVQQQPAGSGWDYLRSAARPSDVLHVALAETAMGFSSEILGSFATDYVDNARLLSLIKTAKAVRAADDASLCSSKADGGGGCDGEGGGVGGGGSALSSTAAASTAAASTVATSSPTTTTYAHYQLTGRDSAGTVVPWSELPEEGDAGALDLAGKRALVTGASRGIGESLALALAARGCALHLASRSKAALDELATRCQEAGASEVCLCVCPATS
jgi:hypothetical protein